MEGGRTQIQVTDTWGQMTLLDDSYEAVTGFLRSECSEETYGIVADWFEAGAQSALILDDIAQSTLGLDEVHCHFERVWMEA